MSNDILSRPIGCLTVQELLSVLDELNQRQSPPANNTKAEEPVYLRGHKELANFLHCSTSTISRLRESGTLDGCCIERGKLILYDRQKVMLALGQKNPRKYEHWKRDY